MISLVLGLLVHAAPAVTSSTTALVLGQKIEVIRSKKAKPAKGETAAQPDPAVAAEQAKKDQELKDRAAKLDEQQKQLDVRAEDVKAKSDELDAKKAEEAKEQAAKKKAIDKLAKDNKAQWNGAVDALGD